MNPTQTEKSYGDINSYYEGLSRKEVSQVLTQRCPRCHSSRIQHGFGDSPLLLRLIGIQELLCNNCNLEFKGFGLISKLNRERSTKDEVIKNSRRTPRLTVRLPVRVAQIENSPGSRELRYSAMLEGHTRLISRVGLALVLPSTHTGTSDFTDTGRRLWVKLALPTGIVVMHVSPMNHKKLSGDRTNTGSLIGARIIKIDDSDRARYFHYLDELGQS